jgi:hypothetical protein
MRSNAHATNARMRLSHCHVFDLQRSVRCDLHHTGGATPTIWRSFARSRCEALAQQRWSIPQSDGTLNACVITYFTGTTPAM